MFELSEAETHTLRNQIIDLVQSPQGRTVGRWLIAEKSREEPDMPGARKAILDMLDSVLIALYSAPAPKVK